MQLYSYNVSVTLRDGNTASGVVDGVPGPVEALQRFFAANSIDPSNTTSRTCERTGDAQEGLFHSVPEAADPASGYEAEQAPDAVSSVADMHAPEAIDHIGRMRSAERLQDIVASDKRVTVTEASQKRLGELTADPADKTGG